MGRGRKGPKGDSRNPKKRATKHDVAPDCDMMDDEIDACKYFYLPILNKFLVTLLGRRQNLG